MMKQQLSALMDGEGDVERSEHIFLAAKSGGELSRTWRDYHLIGDVMRQEAYTGTDMAARVMAQLEEEPTVLAPVRARSSVRTASSRTWVPKASWSIAASVAAAFFVGLFVMQSVTAPTMQMADNDTDQYLVAHHNYAPSSETYYVHNVAYSGE